jgi:hypothetical protein
VLRVTLLAPPPAPPARPRPRTLCILSILGVFGFGPHAPAPLDTTVAERERERPPWGFVAAVAVVEVVAVAVVVETTGLEVEAGSPDDGPCEALGGDGARVGAPSAAAAAGANEEGLAGVLGAESELIITIFIFDRSR